ncbi:MAG: DUF484 family protein [Alphaproteobacteria bacterium]|nr:DUF484 family protein [Alphaproteobacteria bacterium]
MAKRSRIEPRERGEEPEDRLTAEQVADYLRDHPEFLSNHPDLLPLLTPPSHHSGKGVVDMQHYMIERLQKDIERQSRHRNELLSSSRRNRMGQSRVHGAALEIIAASDFEQLVEIISTDLAVRLEVDVVRLCVEAGGKIRKRDECSGIRLLEPGTINRVMGTEQQALLRRTDEPEALIYGSAAPLVASEALLRLRIGEDTPEGLLALGARNPGHFDTGQGTELLQFLARVIETTIRAWLGLAA